MKKVYKKIRISHEKKKMKKRKFLIENIIQKKSLSL